MKTRLYGRVVFGASAVLFGVIALMWHDADTWQNLRKIWSLPFGTIIGNFLMIAQIAGGIGIMFPRTARFASLILGIVYSFFSLACVSSIFAAPKVFAQYESFAEQFALVSGAAALYATTATNAAQSTALSRAARIGLGLCAAAFGVSQAIYLHFTASLVPTWIPPSQIFWAILTTIAFVLAAVAIFINRQARLATRLLTLMLGLFGVLVWIPLLIAHPETHGPWSEFALTFLITGASWMVADLRSF